MNSYYIFAIWIAMALLASLISIRIGLSVALVEILVGAVLGNIPGLKEQIHQTEITTFLAGAGSLMLTFLAGAEIDPVSLRKHWKPSLAIGVVSFLLPFLGAFGFCKLVLGWHLHAAEIGGVALSTTSVAVVYAVMIETGLNPRGPRQAHPGGVFRDRSRDRPRPRRPVCNLRLDARSSLSPSLSSRSWSCRERLAMSSTVSAIASSEPEVKFILVVLFGLGGLATAAGSEAVLPAYVAGLVVAGVFMHDRVLVDRIRSIAFALLTPFFFLHAGLLISAPALASGAGVIAVLFGVKMVTKLLGVWPTASAFHIPARERTYTTLLMATGLTFGSISALFGLTHHLIDKVQYTELVTVVLLSALVPTLVAQQLFRPVLPTDRDELEALGEEDVSVRAPK